MEHEPEDVPSTAPCPRPRGREVLSNVVDRPDVDQAPFLRSVAVGMTPSTTTTPARTRSNRCGPSSGDRDGRRTGRRNRWRRGRLPGEPGELGERAAGLAGAWSGAPALAIGDGTKELVALRPATGRARRVGRACCGTCRGRGLGRRRWRLATGRWASGQRFATYGQRRRCSGTGARPHPALPRTARHRHCRRTFRTTARRPIVRAPAVVRNCAQVDAGRAASISSMTACALKWTREEPRRSRR